MLSYLGRRLILMIPTLIIVTFFVFLLLFLSPGDPVLLLVPADQANQLSAEDLDRLRGELGLDRPFVVQYLDWLGRAVTGDLGRSLHQRRPVTELLANRFPVTLELAILSVLVATLIAIPIGVLTAIRPGSIGDAIGNILALFGASAPNFWVALLLIVLFAVILGWLPAGGFTRFSDDPVEHIRRMVLPVLTLSTSLMAITMRLTRSSMLEVLNAQYIRTARSKGLPDHRTYFVHALKNALIPVITTVGLQVGTVLGGTVAIELIFSFPGMGKLMLDAIYARDFPIVQGGVLYITLSFLVINLLVDLIYAAVDPRIRLS